MRADTLRRARRYGHGFTMLLPLLAVAIPRTAGAQSAPTTSGPTTSGPTTSVIWQSQVVETADLLPSTSTPAAPASSSSTLPRKPRKVRSTATPTTSNTTPNTTPAVVAASAQGDPATRPQDDPETWRRLRVCESGNRYDLNTGNGFYGAYQFAPGTWRKLGYPGLPHEAAPAVQDEAAKKLQAASGWGQWPACSRKLGLR
jgi:hypothetical protein